LHSCYAIKLSVQAYPNRVIELLHGWRHRLRLAGLALLLAGLGVAMGIDAAAGLALVSLVVLAGLLALTGTPGWAHMGSMMATMGTMSGCH